MSWLAIRIVRLKWWKNGRFGPDFYKKYAFFSKFLLAATRLLSELFFMLWASAQLSPGRPFFFLFSDL
jgi:hypothetical protein